MSGELEAAGALTTAGLVAGAIEKGDPGAVGEGACLNCGAQLAGRYCSNCGQVGRPHRTLGGLVAEFAANIWNFDTKAWRTLPMVVFRPGTLTRNYVFGKRARYFSPLATFLLSIFVLFFAFSFVDAPQNTRDTPEEQRAASLERLGDARRELTEAEHDLTLARTAPDPDEPAGLEERLALQAVSLARAEVSRREAQLARVDAEIALAAQEEQERAGAAEGDAQQGVAAPDAEGAASEQPAAETPPPAEQETRDGISVRVDPETGETTATAENWQDGVRRVARSDDFVVFDGNPELNERVRRRLENPDLALYQVQDAASKFAFLLAPLSLPFIALLFLWKRGVTFYDHVVYALYALSFAALMCVAVIIAAQTPAGGWIAGLLLLVGWPVHTWFQLKGAYALGWFSATWRTLFMMLFAGIVLTIFAVLVIILGLAG